jgi:hypothetical protein
MAIQESKELGRRPEQSQTQKPEGTVTKGSTSKRPHSQITVSTIPLKRVKSSNDSNSPPSEPKTPDQPTHPSNPNFSGTSAQSKDEENTKTLLKDLLKDTLSVLESEFCEPKWQRSGYPVELVHSLHTYSNVTNSLEQRTRLDLNWEWRQ